MLNLAPLCGGIPPAIAWRYLERVGSAVVPAAAQPAADPTGGRDLAADLQQLLPTNGA